MLLCKIQPSTATDSLIHCHNRNLHVFFAQKKYSNHWYSIYIDALIEGGNIAGTAYLYGESKVILLLQIPAYTVTMDLNQCHISILYL